MRLLVSGAAAGVVVALTAVSAVADGKTADSVVRQPFSVSVDNCRSSYTEGMLGWDPGPSIGQSVRVDGVVADQASGPCPPGTGRYTEATFRAYRGQTVVDSRSERVDDAVIRIAFVLAATPVIDRMEVEVCRRSVSGTELPLCASEAYPRPRVNQP